MPHWKNYSIRSLPSIEHTFFAMGHLINPCIRCFETALLWSKTKANREYSAQKCSDDLILLIICTDFFCFVLFRFIPFHFRWFGIFWVIFFALDNIEFELFHLSTESIFFVCWNFGSLANSESLYTFIHRVICIAKYYYYFLENVHRHRHTDAFSHINRSAKYDFYLMKILLV